MPDGEPDPRIHFAIASASTPEIQPASPLPALSRRVHIDASSQSGGTVVLDGALLGGGASGLVVEANGTSVRGLTVVGFPGYGLEVVDAAGVTLAANHVGLTESGDRLPNGAGALAITGSDADATVGGTDDGDRNVLYGALDVVDEARARMRLNTLEVPEAQADGLELRSPLDLGADGPTCGTWAVEEGSTRTPPRILELTTTTVRGLTAPADTVVVYRVTDLGADNGRYWARRAEALALGAADATGAFSIPVALAEGERVVLSAFGPDGRTSELSQARRPVIFAPGIGGTWLRDAQGTDLWVPVAFGNEKNARMRRLAMQPDGQTSVENLLAVEVLEGIGSLRIIYGPIHDHLEDQGYTGDPFNQGAPSLDQWRFPNDWRRSAAVLANDLRALIDRVTTDSGETDASAARSCQVDLVAHSNGGVISSVYVQREAEHARDHLHRFLTSGTPYLGADQAYAAHTNGYIFGVEETLLSYLGPWAVAWGDMLAMTRNVPGAYGLLPSENYFEAMDPSSPSYSHGYGLVDLLNEPLVGYDATIQFLTNTKTQGGILPLGMERNGSILSDQATSVLDVIGDWRSFEGPPHIFRHVGQLVGMTEVGWFMGNGPALIPAGGTLRSEAGDTDRHRAYRENLQAIMGFGDKTVPLLSASLGRNPLVGDTDFSGVDESPWIEETERYACEHGELVVEDCRPVAAAPSDPDALDRITQILRSGSVVPAPPSETRRADAVVARAAMAAEVVYALATAPITVTVMDASGRLTGPPELAAPEAILYEVPGIAYHATRYGVTLGLRPDSAYTVRVRSSDPDAIVTLVRQKQGLDAVTQILYPDQALATGGTLTFELAETGTASDVPWARDADGDGTSEGTVAPAAVFEGVGARLVIPIPQPNAVDLPAADGSDVQTATLRLPSTGADGWTFTLDETAPWLSLSATSGAIPAEIDLTMDPAGLPDGDSQTEIALTLTNGDYTRQTSIPITLRVGVFVAGEEAPGVSAPAELALHPPAPNPARGSIALAFDLAEAVPVRVSIHDALGREVAVPVEGLLPSGTHEARLDADGLAPGVYVVRLTAGDVLATQPLTIVR